MLISFEIMTGDFNALMNASQSEQMKIFSPRVPDATQEGFRLKDAGETCQIETFIVYRWSEHPSDSTSYCHRSFGQVSYHQNCFFFQLKPIHMKANELTNHCGLFSRFTIKSHGTFTIYTSGERLSAVSCMITAFEKRSLTLI